MEENLTEDEKQAIDRALKKTTWGEGQFFQKLDKMENLAKELITTKQEVLAMARVLFGRYEEASPEGVHKGKLIGWLQKHILKTREYTLGPGAKTINPMTGRPQITGDPDLYYPSWNGWMGENGMDTFAGVFLGFKDDEKLKFCTTITKEAKKYGLNVKPLEVEELILSFKENGERNG